MPHPTTPSQIKPPPSPSPPPNQTHRSVYPRPPQKKPAPPTPLLPSPPPTPTSLIGIYGLKVSSPSPSKIFQFTAGFHSNKSTAPLPQPFPRTVQNSTLECPTHLDQAFFGILSSIFALDDILRKFIPCSLSPLLIPKTIAASIPFCPTVPH